MELVCAVGLRIDWEENAWWSVGLRREILLRRAGIFMPAGSGGRFQEFRRSRKSFHVNFNLCSFSSRTCDLHFYICSSAHFARKIVVITASFYLQSQSKSNADMNRR